MAKPVLAVTRRLPEAVEARAAQEYDARLSADDHPVESVDILRLSEGAAALLCTPAEQLDAATIAALPSTVRVIATFSVGFDHIDVPAARQRKLPVLNTPDVLSVATAELAMLLILAAGRRVIEGDRLVRSGTWAGWAPTQLLGIQVSGRRLGIFGMGRIGRELARMARGFDMEVHYRDQRRLPPELEAGAIFHQDDASFLAASQILSLNAPGSGDTHHWLNETRISLLPEGAVVVNAARGALVDDAALIAALRSGRLGAAGLDVYEGEPKLNHGYAGLDNVILLPHLGSNALETRIAMGMLALDGIAAVLEGRVPANLVK